jgi:pyridoxal biosynthesis lyase PdxS
MASTQDFSSMMKDMMGNMPVDTAAMDTLVRSQAALAERMSAVAIEAAQRSTTLSAKWAQDTLSKLSTMTQAKAEPADYAKSMAEFMTGSAEAAAEHMAAFAEIAKKVQTETLELLMSGAKDMGQQMTAAAQKAGTDVTEAARQAQATNV